MTHLIDKAALVAEIEKRKAINEKSYMQAFLNSNDNRDSFGYKVQEDIDILSLLDTIDVKEVDLEKYYHEFLQKEWFGKNCGRTVSEMMAFTAKHFFELGRKAAQKGEEV